MFPLHRSMFDNTNLRPLNTVGRLMSGWAACPAQVPSAVAEVLAQWLEALRR